jgi:hypothetical protein
LGLNSAACPRRARGINGDDLRRALVIVAHATSTTAEMAKKTQRSTVRSLPAPGARSSDNHCAKASTLCPNRTPWVLTRGLPLGRFLEGHSFGGALPDSSPTAGRALKA